MIFFVNNTKEFYRFYKDKMLCLTAQPNAAHLFLTKLENAGKLNGIVTQNIDGLHSLAQSHKIFELHGSVHRNYCQSCGKLYDAEYILNSKDIPLCSCGSVIKPDVVLYDETLDNLTVENSIKAIAAADTLIVAGTSLTVYPAAGLIRYFRGDNLVLINRDKTELDAHADLVLHRKVGEVFSELKI